MPLFKSIGNAQGKYNPGGGRKKKYSRVLTSKDKRGKYSKTKVSKYNVKGKYKTKSKGSANVKNKIKLKYNDVYNLFLDNQLHIYRYPFSTRTKHPKIPDGKVDNSIGLSFNLSGVFNTEAEVPNFIVLLPGLTGCMLIGRWSLDGVEITNRAYFIQHCLPQLSKVSGGLGDVAMEDDEEDPMANKLCLDYRQTGYSKYRYVSCGLRCGPANLAYSGTGGWEAIRVPMTKNLFSINIKDAIDERDQSFNHVTCHTIFMDILKDKWEKNPTFQTGAIKELGNYEFRLKCEDHTHEFVEIPRFLELDNTEITATGFNIIGDGVDKTHLFDYTTDRNFDCICIRFNDFNSAEEIGYHVVANMEMIPSESGQMFSFSTASVKGTSKLLQTEKSIEKYHRLPGVLNAKKTFTSRRNKGY